ncbi:hypothetical protein [Rhodoferax antarcticus]|uniref:hypothetical protein n=1 Tax=Rhodoferax antarcticus TaxID=81479 RepID=UPI00094F75F9|nr:hypothetical protein [Rhodoferax antarcticus]
MALFIYNISGAFVAQIVKQSKLAFGYRPHEPWLLLYNSGRTERFAQQSEAKTEARKSWSKCRFSKRVAVIGNPIDGLTFAGPFDSVDEVAVSRGKSGEPWHIAPLIPPHCDEQHMGTLDQQPDPEMKLTQIGVIDNGCDGSDAYALVERLDGEYLSVEVAEKFAFGIFGRSCKGPGSRYCDVVRAFKVGSQLDVCLCVAEIRYDV